MFTSVSFAVCFVVAHVSSLSLATPAQNSTYFLPNRYKRQSSCKPIEFKCGNGDCIPSYNVCDGPKHCIDGSDEKRSICQTIKGCPSQAFECAYGACIDSDLKCDSKNDCADGSDEVECASSTCGKFESACANGECINQYSFCDGTKDCSDGSDETREKCKDISCPSSSFQCDYGACLERSVRCNGFSECVDGSDELGCPGTGSGITSTSPGPTPSTPIEGGCRLPAHPLHGVYVSTLCQAGDSRAGCRNTPGTLVPSNWLLKYSCNQNYDLTSSDAEFSVCDNGVWKNQLDCIKLCPPLKSISVDVRCWYGGREVTCNRPMKPNTTATAKCKQHYTEAYVPEYSSLTCLDNGDWNYRLFYCTPDCGVSIKSEALETLILEGHKSHQGEFPWLAALYYRNMSQKWEQKCAGTLINPHVVLTAAHCLVTTQGNIMSAKELKVGLGKYHRNFYKYENYSVITDVREIVIPRFYSGGASFYALDIGLLDLVVSIQVTAFIMPACVDWQSSLSVTTGDIGHVAGWGTTENKTSSETVLSAELQYIDNAACIKQVRQAYKKLVTHDKFCAGSVNGSQVDKGDSGGGLTLVRRGQHFVFGVVSTKIVEETQFSLFTDITNAEHHTWLEEQRNRLNQLHRET